MAIARQRQQDLRDPRLDPRPAALEQPRDSQGIQRCPACRQYRFDRQRLFVAIAGKYRLTVIDGDDDCVQRQFLRFRGQGFRTRHLIVRPQPPYVALGLIARTLSVERDQPRQNVLIGKVQRPAIGGDRQTVDRVVQFLEDQHETALP